MRMSVYPDVSLVVLLEKAYQVVLVMEVWLADPSFLYQIVHQEKWSVCKNHNYSKHHV